MEKIPDNRNTEKGLFTETRKAVVVLEAGKDSIEVESFNKSFRDIFQVKKSGSALEKLRKSAFKPEKVQKILESILEGKKMSWNLEINCRDGLKTFRVENIEISDPGDAKRIFLIFSDVTSRNAREEKIKSFQKASMDFIECRDDKSVAEKISEIASRDLGFRKNIVRLAAEDSLKVLAHSGLEPVKNFPGDYRLDDDEAAVKCFRTGKTVYSSSPVAYKNQGKLQGKDPIHVPVGNYGVITCFVDDSRRVDSTDIELLQMLGRTGNFVIDFVRQQPNSFENAFVELELHSTGSENFIADLAEKTGRKFSIVSVSPRSGPGEILYIKKDGGNLAGLGKELENHEKIVKCSLPDPESDEGFLRVETGSASVLKTIISSGARIKEVSAGSGLVKILVQVSGSLEMSRVFERLRGGDSSWKLVRKNSVGQEGGSMSEGDLRDDLTGKQFEAVREAFRSGYYSYPRESTAEEIASSLGISDSTLFQHLQAAHRKIIRRHLSSLGENSFMPGGNDN